MAKTIAFSCILFFLFLVVNEFCAAQTQGNNGIVRVLDNIIPLESGCPATDAESIITFLKNKLIVGNGCNDNAIVNVSMSGSGLMLDVQPIELETSIRFDNLGFLVKHYIWSTQPGGLAWSGIRNQSLDGKEYWSASLPVKIRFIEFDQNNNFHVVGTNQHYQIFFYQIDNNGTIISTSTAANPINYDLLNHLQTATMTPDGHWLTMIKSKLLSFRNGVVLEIDDFVSFQPNLWIHNLTAFYALKTSKQLFLYQYDGIKSIWNGSPYINLSVNCDAIQVLASNAVNLLMTCKTLNSISILGFLRANSRVMPFPEPTIYWQLNSTGLQVTSIIWLSSLKIVLLRCRLENVKTVEGFPVPQKLFTWLFVSLNISNEYDEIKSDLPLPIIETPGVTLRNPSVKTGSNDSNSFYIIIGCSLGFTGLIFSFSIFLFLFRKYRGKQRDVEESLHIRSQTCLTVMSSESAATLGSVATTNFSKLTLNSYQKEFSIPGYLLIDTNKDIQRLQKIAVGGMAAIYLAKIQATTLAERCHSNMCVVKALSGKIDGRELSAFRQEVAIMSFFQKQPNYAQIVGYAETPSPTILMKHYSIGSMADWIHKENQAVPYSPRVVLRFASNIITGILNMHRANLVHCDIKPANILLNQDSQYGLCAVLTDFGITRILDSTMLVRAFQVMNKSGWSVAYCPPEAFKSMFASKEEPSAVTLVSECSQQILKSTDVYMFGMSVYELISRKAPFSGVKNVEKVIESIWKGERPCIDWDLMKTDPILAGLADVVVQCWNQSPESRPLPQDLVLTLKRLKQNIIASNSEKSIHS